MRPSELVELLTEARAAASGRPSSVECRTKFVVLDVREEDLIGGHIPGSVNVPAVTFQNEIMRLADQYRDMDKIILHCFHSQNSTRCSIL